MTLDYSDVGRGLLVDLDESPIDARFGRIDAQDAAFGRALFLYLGKVAKNDPRLRPLHFGNEETIEDLRGDLIVFALGNLGAYDPSRGAFSTFLSVQVDAFLGARGGAPYQPGAFLAFDHPSSRAARYASVARHREAMASAIASAAPGATHVDVVFKIKDKRSGTFRDTTVSLGLAAMEEALALYRRSHLSLDAPVGEDKETSLGEVITGLSLDEGALGEVRAEILIKITRLFERIRWDDPRKRVILIERVLALPGRKVSLKDLGKRFDGISKERVRQLEEKVFARVRAFPGLPRPLKARLTTFLEDMDSFEFGDLTALDHALAQKLGSSQ